MRLCYDCEHIFVGSHGEYCEVYNEMLVSTKADDCPSYSEGTVTVVNTEKLAPVVSLDEYRSRKAHPAGRGSPDAA